MDDTSLEKLSKVIRDSASATLEPKDTIELEAPVNVAANDSQAQLTEENLVRLQEIEEEEEAEATPRKKAEEGSEAGDKVEELPAQFSPKK